MKSKIQILLGSLLLGTQTLAAQTSAFTYQGRLNDHGAPANGSYDLTFALFSVGNGPGQVGGTLTNSLTAVSNGLFTVVLNFGPGPFSGGAPLWLDIAARTNGGGGFTSLSPRQSITAAPYSLTASNLTGVLPPSGLSGTYASPVTFNNGANSFTGGGSGLTGLNASSLSSGTMADARLSPNAALLDRSAQTFTGTNVFNNRVGINAAAPAVPLHVDGGTDASLAGGGYIIAGALGGANAVLDNNELQARNNGAAATLLLNNEGGTVAFGGNVGIGTQTPQADLHIRGGGTNGSLIISPGTSDSQSQILLAENSGRETF